MISPTSGVYNCNVLHLSKIQCKSGNITVAQYGTLFPFPIKRIYYLYDIPGGATRGGHSHKILQQFIIAASGSFDVLIDDGRLKKVIHLDRPDFGLLILPGIWRELINFSSGAICLVLASEKFTEDDYIRDYSAFIQLKKLSNAD